MIFTSYKLDNYLTKDYIYKNLSKPPINKLPEIDNILFKIKNFLEENAFSNSFVGHGQQYSYTHRFPNGDFYEIKWDIDIAKIIIKEEKLTIENLSVNKLALTISEDAIIPSYLTQALNNEKPIIVAYLYSLDCFVVLDGNHRIISRFKDNRSSVKGYILHPQQHFVAMVDDTSRAIYLSTVAIKFIADFLIGSILKEELMECINGFDNFYEISVQKEIDDMLSKH